MEIIKVGIAKNKYANETLVKIIFISKLSFILDLNGDIFPNTRELHGRTARVIIRESIK